MHSEKLDFSQTFSDFLETFLAFTETKLNCLISGQTSDDILNVLIIEFFSSKEISGSNLLI
jgi:hypothetical protein